MRTRSILLAAGVLTMSLAPIISGQVSASAQMYDFTTIAGAVTNAGSADGTNSDARFYYPIGVAVDTNGNLYVADSMNDTIRKVTPVGTNLSTVADWVTTTIAGLATNWGSVDGTNSAARFHLPMGVAADTDGNVYVADANNYTIRKITPVGTNWVTTTIAGLAGQIGHDDGTNSDARFDFPYGVAVDTNGNLYVTDFINNTIRKITPVGTNWVTTTIAGLAGPSDYADGTNSDARFNAPYGVAVDTNGNVYVVDMDNHIIRKVAPVGTNWVTTTIAGLVLTVGADDGTNRNARFHYPEGIAADSSGNLYVADRFNDTIRKIAPVGTNWVTTTVAGLAGNSGTADGIGRKARFNYPEGITADGSGNLYVADSYNDTIRLGVPLDILRITKESAKVNFNPAKLNADSCAFTGTLTLESGFSVTNAGLTVDIGGAQASFILDAKGRGASPTNTCKLTYKKKTGPWTFTATLKKGSWATQWETYGLSNSTVRASSVTLPVVLEIGGETFAGEKNLLYKAKADKSGTAK